MLNVYNYHTEPKSLIHGIAPPSMEDVVNVVKQGLASILELAEDTQDEIISTLKWSMHGQPGSDSRVVFLVNVFLDSGRSTGFVTLTETVDDVLVSILHEDEEIGHASAYIVPGVISEEEVVDLLDELVITLVGY